MSKQSEAKLNQGFKKDSPKCSNCGYFSSIKTEEKSKWSSHVFIKESELRCKKGGFKIGKSNWCSSHCFLVPE